MTANELQDILFIRAEDFREINARIEWFQRLPVGHQDIDGLMECRRVLSTIGTRLALYVGQLARAYNAAEGQRKVRFFKLREEYKRQGESVASAESKAENEIVPLREEEFNALGRYQSGKMLADSINHVLNALAGEINYLMREKFNAGKENAG